MIKMKQSITLTGLLLLAAVSCSRQPDGGAGFIRFAVDSDDFVTEVTKSNVSDYAMLPSAQDFTLTLSDASGNEIYNGLLKNYDSSTAVKVGSYTATASYGSSSVEGFDKPYFSGQSSFTVAQGTTSTVTIPASLANSMVKLAFTDTFTSYFTDYSFTIKTGAGTKIAYAKGETRAAFMDAYTFTLTGTLTSQGGKTQTLTYSKKGLEAKKCYTIKFDASNVGNGTISISFDDTVEDVQLDEVDLND